MRPLVAALLAGLPLLVVAEGCPMVTKVRFVDAAALCASTHATFLLCLLLHA